MTDQDESRAAVLEHSDAPREPVQTHTLDTLFKNMGGCGRFQVIFFCLGYFPMAPATWVLMFMIFAKYNPGWTCQDTLTVNATEFLEPSRNMSLPATRDGRSLSGNETRLSSCDAMKLCENVTFNDGASTIVTEWALLCDDAWVFSLIFTIHMSGVILGSFLGGYLADNIGRKFSIHGSAALLSITNIIAIFSGSWQMYAVMRFIIGIGCGGILSSVPVYAFEFIPAWWRGSIGTFPLWNVATLFFGLCVMALKNWKYVHIATAFLSLLAFLPVVWLPESLRFLTVHGKLKRGHKVVEKIARLNRRPIPDTSIMTAVAETERENMETRSRYTYRDLFNKNFRKPSIVLGMAWLIFSIGTYMVGFGLAALSGNFYVNFLLYTSLPLVFRLIVPFVVTKVGRKYACLIFLFISIVCCFIFVALQLLVREERRGTPSVVFAFGSFIFLHAAWGPVTVMGIELFPTGIRNLSHAYFSVMARIGAITSSYLIRKDTLPLFGSFLLLGLLYIVLFAALLILHETRKTPLPDNLIRESTKPITRESARTI